LFLGSPCLRLFEANVFDCLDHSGRAAVVKNAPRSLLSKHYELLQARHTACIVVECVEKATDKRYFSITISTPEDIGKL
jgi:hypothetical protein